MTNQMPGPCWCGGDLSSDGHIHPEDFYDFDKLEEAAERVMMTPDELQKQIDANAKLLRGRMELGQLYEDAASEFGTRRGWSMHATELRREFGIEAYRFASRVADRARRFREEAKKKLRSRRR